MLVGSTSCKISFFSLRFFSFFCRTSGVHGVSFFHLESFCTLVYNLSYGHSHLVMSLYRVALNVANIFSISTVWSFVLIPLLNLVLFWTFPFAYEQYHMSWSVIWLYISTAHSHADIQPYPSPAHVIVHMHTTLNSFLSN